MLGSMSPEELRQVMRDLGCNTQQSLGDRIGVSRSAVCMWNKVGVPRHVAMLLRLLVAS
ncbi:MAG: hypothetical protein JWR80_9463 [Bradyrhizobium sp.]|nr:hypothetical protein [Bradyrhizobium sp.]